jgi:hypothetical protein
MSEGWQKKTREDGANGCAAEAWWVRGKPPPLGRQGLGLMSCEVWPLSLVLGTPVIVQGAATPVLDAMPLVDKIWDDKPYLDPHDGLLWQLAHDQKFIGK